MISSCVSFLFDEFLSHVNDRQTKHRCRSNQNHKSVNWIIYTFVAEAEIDDEGIERDSEEIDDEKFSDTKELDHVLEVS